MIISITGVAGTGKTSVARELAKMLNARVIHLSRLTEKVSCGYDKVLKAHVVDTEKLRRVVAGEVKRSCENHVIVEGLLSHHVDSDVIILLRLSPEEIEKRLKKRRYPRIKIKENLEAEILDQIYAECLERARNKKIRIIQINTTGKTVGQIAKRIFNILRCKNYRSAQKVCGVEVLGDYVDWLEKYEKYIIEWEGR